MSCISRVKEFYDVFTSSEKQIADYILANSSDALELTSVEMSEIVGVSPATVIRFSKAMGFSGYSDMKLDLARDVENLTQNEVNELIQSGDTMTEMAKKYASSFTRVITDTMSLIKDRELETAVDVLKRAETIYIYGVGASGLVAEDLQKKLVRINKRCVYYTDYNLGLASAIHITKKDAVLAISYSGQTKEVNMAAELGQKVGAKVIAISRCRKSRLTSLTDVNLFIPSTEREVRIGAMQSRTAQLFVTDLLYMGLIRDRFDAVEACLESSRKIILQLKDN